MAISHQATTTNSGSGRSGASFSHNSGAGSDRLLLAYITRRDGVQSSVSAVTYNAVALAKVNNTAVDRNYTTSPERWLMGEWWYLVAPATGANTLAATYSEAVESDAVMAVTLNGCHQTSPVAAGAGDYGHSEVPLLSVTTGTAGSWILCGVGKRYGPSGGSYTPGSGNVELADGEAGTLVHDVTYTAFYRVMATAGNHVMFTTQSGNSTTWVIGGLEVKQALAGGAAGVLPLLMENYRRLRV
jgi:hypothetical protein